jgi:hypothetical protein
MTATSNGSGYVIGVNLGAATIFLNIGVSITVHNAIITSTQNWQTQNGTNQSGSN